MCRSSTKRRAGKSAAFTVTELMVAVSLMSVVIYALYSVFNQTQRALRSNESQIDTTERGRGVLELIARDMELARVGHVQAVTNFSTAMAPWGRIIQEDREPNSFVTDRTNVLHTVYFLTQKERGWRGIGYGLYLRNPTNEQHLEPTQWGMGSLYRYETVTNYGLPTTNLFAEFARVAPNAMNPPTAANPIVVTNFNHIADGVVHLRVTAYDTQGHLMAFNTTNRDPAYRIFRCMEGGGAVPNGSTPGITAGNQLTNATAVLQAVSDFDFTESRVSYRSNAAPAYVDIELGVLEPDAVKTFDLMLSDARKMGEQPTRARQWLEKRVGKVQIFRKRIPLRTVSP